MDSSLKGWVFFKSETAKSPEKLLSLQRINEIPYSKICLKQPLKNRQSKDINDKC